MSSLESESLLKYEKTKKLVPPSGVVFCFEILIPVVQRVLSIENLYPLDKSIDMVEIIQPGTHK